MNFNLRARFTRSIGRRFIIEWLAIGCLGIAVVFLSSIESLTTSADRLVYDHFLGFLPQQTSADIVVVEIDNTSIAQLGRWPWPRSIHARLLDALAKAKPAAIVYDVLFTEPTQDDTQFAQALAATPTYLPVLLNPADGNGRRLANLPVTSLAHAAVGLGHINFEVDEDGLVRSVALFEGDMYARWPQLMVPPLRAIASGALKLQHDTRIDRRKLDGVLEGRDEARFLIPFNLQAQGYPKLSVLSVLAGEVPDGSLRGKIVLIGMTASGVFHLFATPVSGELGPMPAVYLHANVLDTLLNSREIYPVGSTVSFFASLAPLAVLLAGFLELSPRRTLLLMMALSCAIAAASEMLLYNAHLWMSPVPAMLGLVVMYPIWNWRRLEMTMSYLRQELRRLADEPSLLLKIQHKPDEFSGDVLEQQMALMAQAAQHMQDMKRFVWDSLNSMPEPILVCDLNGVVLIANQAAKTYFARLDAPRPEGRGMREVLGELRFVKTITVTDGVNTETAFATGDNTNSSAHAVMQAEWPALLDPAHREYASTMERGIEVRDREEHDHLLRYAKCTNTQGVVTGWIAGLVDVSAVHAAERQREDALTLLSHDMRSPQVSIVALVEIERTYIKSDRIREVLDRIERYALRALELADDFVQLARAESQVYVWNIVSLVELASNASEEVWPQAHAKQIQFKMQFDDKKYWIRADPSLMTRALVNIFNNAVKYSPSGTQITCTIAPDDTATLSAPARVQCAISDQGYGISAEQQVHLFERFRRFHTADQPKAGGTGLGLVFVKTVIVRHGGAVRVESVVGVGTTFITTLPVLDEAAA